jgi:hypothetical protein
MVALDWIMHRRVLWRLFPAINFVSIALHRKRESICLIGSLFGASYWMKIIVVTINFILLGPSTFELAAVSDTNLITLQHQSRHDREIRPTDEIESSYDDELGHDAIGQHRTSMTF